MTTGHRSIGKTIVCGLLVIWTTAAWPQSATFDCIVEQITGSRHVLSCRGGTKITAEQGARYSLIDRNKDGEADGVVLRRRALLLESARRKTGGFVVITPQAIAAVRGTKWAVDVQVGKTAVFVVVGRVQVQRPTSGDSVLLRPGQGVDVDRGSGQLTVRRWPAARVSALMARLGE